MRGEQKIRAAFLTNGKEGGGGRILFLGIAGVVLRVGRLIIRARRVALGIGRGVLLRIVRDGIIPLRCLVGSGSIRRVLSFFSRALKIW